MSSDLALGALTLIIACAYYTAAAAMPESLLADAVGPQGLPKVYALALGGLSLVLIGRSLTARRPRTAPPSPGAAATGAAKTVETSPAAMRAAGMLLIGVAYVLAVPYIGYIPALAGLLTGTAAYQARAFSTRTAAVGAAGAALLWLLFVVLLGIPQPQGPWPSIF